MFSLSMFGPIRGLVFRHSVFRCSVPFDVQSFDVQSHSRFGLSMFGPFRHSVIRGSVFRRSVFRGSVFRGSVSRGSVTVSQGVQMLNVKFYLNIWIHNNDLGDIFLSLSFWQCTLIDDDSLIIYYKALNFLAFFYGFRELWHLLKNYILNFEMFSNGLYMWQRDIEILVFACESICPNILLVIF